MRSIVLFSIVLLAAAGGMSRVADRISAPSRAGASPGVATPVAAERAPVSTGGPRSVTVMPGRRGHFEIEGAVDGRRIGFMVDTGASTVALRERDAARLGLHPSRRDYSVPIATANGIVRAAPVKLGRVEIGGVMVRQVEAIVLPDEALSENLLGLSFLSRLHRFEYSKGRLILEE
jgi:aspartyl protease family protein